MKKTKQSEPAKITKIGPFRIDYTITGEAFGLFGTDVLFRPQPLEKLVKNIESFLKEWPACPK